MTGRGEKIPAGKKKGRDNPALLLSGARLDKLREDRVICEVLSVAGGKGSGVYLVGGVLRNLALGLAPGADYDFVLASGVKRCAAALARRLSGTAFVLDKSAPSYRVLVKKVGCTIDLSPLKDGEINADLAARDFTVNAMAVELSGLFGGAPEIIDPTGGLKDAGKGVLRATSGTVCRADPLRCLRAVRLAQRHGLRIHGPTAGLIKRDSALVARVSAERVRDELIEMFTLAGTTGALKELYSLGIMDAVLPEFVDWMDIGGGYDLLAHTLKTVDEAEAILAGVLEGRGFKEAARLGEYFSGSLGPVKRAALLKLAAFLHDAGKPLTIGVREGRLRFFGHEYEGGVRVKEVLRRLKFSRKATALITSLVDNHHRVFSYARLERPTSRARAHLFRAMEGAPGVDLCMLSLADARATRGGEDAALKRVVDGLIRYYYTDYTFKRARPLLTGADVIRELGIPEGRLVGEVLEEVCRGVEEGVIKTRASALEHARKWLTRSGGL